jgi:DNA repair ATPase RecN
MRIASPSVPETRVWPVVAAAAFAVVVALVVGGIYLLVQIHDMSEHLSRLTTQLNSLQTMNQKLDTLTAMNTTLNGMNGKLSETNRKLEMTNTLLRMSNAKLTTALAAADGTNQGLNRMQDLLGGMQGSLRTMEANIGRMTQKIVHAALLF